MRRIAWPAILLLLAGPSTWALPEALASAPAAASKGVHELFVVFGLTGRDVAGELPFVLRNIQRLGSQFAAAHVVFTENDSSDNSTAVFDAWAERFTFRARRRARALDARRTRVAMRVWHRRPDSAQAPPTGAGHNRHRSAHLLSFHSGAGKKSLRLLAHARNLYLDYLDTFRQADFLIAVDTDMCQPWNVPVFVDVLGALLPHVGSEWQVLYANGICGWYLNPRGPDERGAPAGTPGAAGYYCDLLALRDSSGGGPYNSHDPVWLTNATTCDLHLMSPKVASAFDCKLLAGQPVITVQSGFGGWALYHADLLRSSAAPAEGEAGPGGQALRGSTGDDAAAAPQEAGEQAAAGEGAGQGEASLMPDGCRHAESEEGCEHVSLAACFRERGAIQLLATSLVVDWEGCSEEYWAGQPVDAFVNIS